MTRKLVCIAPLPLLVEALFAFASSQIAGFAIGILAVTLFAVTYHETRKV
jgi:hypothetical protein